VNDEKLKDPKHMVTAFNNLFIIINEKLNIQQIGKDDDISILRDSFPGNFPRLKIILITELR
jgi:hypothetical protein